MIPIYKAIEFKGEMSGGTTRPWLVTVLRGNQPASYVVKLYSEQYNEQNCTVLKECLCSRLAKEFDLCSPDCALIEFTHDFIKSLPTEYRHFLQKKDQRLKFATALIQSPYENYSPALKEEFLKIYDLATIYAFDNLILNVDRRTEKPNMFFKDRNVLLIDHELTLSIAHNAKNELLNNEPWTHNFQRHLFYPFLKEMKQSEKKGCLDTFSYYLTELIDFDILDQIYEQLDEYEHPVDAYGLIKSYLYTANKKAGSFIKKIEYTLQ